MALERVRTGLRTCLLGTMRCHLANGVAFAARARAMTSDRESQARDRQYAYARSAYDHVIALRSRLDLADQTDEIEGQILALGTTLARAGA